MDIQKKIAFFIEKQFPAVYREYGPELVQLVEDYYRFLEETENQSHYNNRRIFEYRDISTTLNSMLYFFKNKYLKDLPFDEDNIKFLVRNILDLYRRKGSREGIILFFRLFYQEDAEVYYPSQQILKPSNSRWTTGSFLQLFPNDNYFTDIEGNEFTYNDLVGRNIQGSISKAKAAVNRINFIVVNNTLTPVIYIDSVKGTFLKYDEIFTKINGNVVQFGRVNGSLSDFVVTNATAVGVKKGQILDVESDQGKNGSVVVTSTTKSPSGQVSYEIVDGGFGYTTQNTRLIVSNQSIILDNRSLSFTFEERLRDTAGNEGFVVGQNVGSVGLRMNGSDSFDISRPISTLDRSPNITITGINTITTRNDSSPGNMFADTGLATDVKVSSLANEESISLITDVISDFVSVSINASNYNDPPAAQPMSGSADPVTIATALDDAFDLEPFTIGTIENIVNINPGDNYQNDVFSYASDEVMKRFQRNNQIAYIDPPQAATIFDIGSIITEVATGKTGKVVDTNGNNGTITFIPYNYYGFSGDSNVTDGATEYTVLSISTDYSSKLYGENATIKSTTEFQEGRVETVRIYNSGLGYTDDATANLLDSSGNIVAEGTISVDTQGVTAGYWADFSSHINGYIQDAANTSIYDYYDSNMRVHDNDYFQEFSYEIKSSIPLSKYETLLKENVHLAGTKLFSKFYYTYKNDSETSARFSRIFNDNGKGSPLDTANTANITSDITNLYVDSTTVTSDNVNV